MSTYKISKNGADYSVKLPEDKYPFAIDFRSDNSKVVMTDNNKSTITRIGDYEDSSSLKSLQQATLDLMFNGSRNIRDLKIVSKHKSKNWCLVLIGGKVEGWFETELIRADA